MAVSDPAASSEHKKDVTDNVQQKAGVESDKSASVEGSTEAPAPLKFKHVHIIVNPASGQRGLNLPALNKVLTDLEIEWEMFVTRKGGEAGERAQQAVATGVDAVVVYGGDGTVLEVASGLSGSDTPLIILPGGTANVLSVELGIPFDQTQAALLLGGVPNMIWVLDMGLLAGAGKDEARDGDLLFFHLGMGIEGTMNENADRSAKDRSGMFAYIVGALRTLSTSTSAHYQLTLDGETVEADGINCMITNFGSVGVPGIKLSNKIDMSDGLLDVVIIQDANVSSLLSAAANAVASGELAQPLLQWQAREITVKVNPVQKIVVDGELIEADEVSVRVVPHTIRVVTPALSSA